MVEYEIMKMPDGQYGVIQLVESRERKTGFQIGALDIIATYPTAKMARRKRDELNAATQHTRTRPARLWKWRDNA